MEAKRGLLLTILLLTQMVTTHVVGIDRQVDSPEASRQIQEILKAAWRSSGATQAHTQQSQGEVICAWLRPLEAVVVWPQVATADFGRYPFSETLVKTTVESALRRKGVTVIDATRLRDPLKTATLRIVILGKVDSGTGMAGVCMLLKLEQEVALVAADTPTFARADTWQRAAFLTGTPRDIRNRYPRELQELAGLFCDDWDASRPGGVAETRP
jgi:hypothetical protein